MKVAAPPDWAIDVQSVSKAFRIPSVRRQTIREHALDMFRRRPAERLTVLNDVSFRVARGESIALMGRNGSGKSTLLKIVAGIFAADRGTVRASGALTPILELGVGFNPELDAIDNIYLLGTVMGLSLSEIRGRLDEILAFAELERFARLKLQHFSSGMIARLAYAVAFSAVSEILLLDEIFAVGDAAFKTRCEDRYRELVAAGHTVVMVSHDPYLVAELCDRAILLEQGRVVLDGPAADVAEAYLKMLAGPDAVSVAPAAVDYEQWSRAQELEASWWREWFATGGLDWPEDYRRLLAPDRPVQSRIAKCLPQSGTPVVLDVGSGPVSRVGTWLGQRRIHLTSIDPLADCYRRLLASHGYDSALGPIAGDGESLTEVVPADHFDLVSIENALGHTRDPLRVIDRMLSAAKVGGRVLILDEENEADANAYRGLDHWNLTIEDGRFVIWNPSSRLDVARHLRGRAEVRATILDDPGYRRAVSVEMIKLPGGAGQREGFHRTMDAALAMTV
jgi:ABC-type polysaccharide/polyol phosphate transport system ATPase subunit/SAM-dependent methyltransferase